MTPLPHPRAEPVSRARRPRGTSPRVVRVDRIARVVITAGGLGVIAAVLGILLYLVAVVSPLFSTGSAGAAASFPLLTSAEAASLAFIDVDEQRAAGAALLATGEAIAFDARTGAVLARRRIVPEGPALTAWTLPDFEGRFAAGFSDGGVRTGSVSYETTFETAGEKSGGPDADTVEVVTAAGTRRVRPLVAIGDLLVEGHGAAARRLDHRADDSATRVALLTEDGRLRLVEAVRRRTLRRTSGEAQVSTTEIPLPHPPGAGALPDHLLLSSRGDQMHVAWRTGDALRYDLRDRLAPAVVERLDLAPGDGTSLTALRFSTGEQSILSGDSRGEVRAWFRVPGHGGGDGFTLATAHAFPGDGSAVSALAGSSRDKSFLTACADGSLVLRHLTSERILARMRLDPAAAAAAAWIAPKGDAALAVTDQGRVVSWNIEAPHPETSLRALFGRVWYEGYPGPGFTWQSSSGTDDFEPKLSLVPLVSGTMKATFYALLFAVPIALCAAIYTSEFLDRRTRAVLKPLIEMMASLPSVVLGFIAALVLAPLVESWAFATLCLFGLVPVAALAAGYAWEMLPRRWTVRVGGGTRLALLLALCAGSIVIAPRLAGPLERLLFGGDLRGWLSGSGGSGGVGVGLLAWPLILAGLLVVDRRREGRPRKGPSPWGHRTPGRSLIRCGALVLLSVAAACAAGWLASKAGFDPRGSIVGPYVQRNALVVGFVMGFAVIPIIYTIAEDALSSVPRSLRSASLGCGATSWQTAMRVVLPIAMPGIFSAVMVGLGRAVGETMIVLMAAGNTPVMDINIFSGLRTLSANIAVELPEAVKDGTLYRILFLSALLLFVITFLLNTVAEIVRQRFRRRALQL